MKRILSSVLIVLMVGVLLSAYAMADGTPTLSVSDAGEAEPGEEVTFTVDISDNPGIAAFTMKVTYDEDRLELNKVKHTGMGGGTWLVNEDSVGWFAFHDYDYDGELLKLTFTVKEDAPNGDAAVSIGYTDGNIGNFDEETVYFDVEAGGVTISGGSEAPAEDNDTPDEETHDSADAEDNSNSTVSENSSEGSSNNTNRTTDSNQNTVSNGDSQSAIAEDEDASLVTDNVSENERNNPEDVTVYEEDIETEQLKEDSVPPAEDAEEENDTEENAESTEKESTSFSSRISVKTHSLLWLWILLGVLALLVVLVVLYLFVFKKDTGRH